MELTVKAALLQLLEKVFDMPAIRRENEIDFYLVPDAICHSPSFQGMKFIPLFDEKFVYLLHQKYRLAQKQEIKEKDLDDEIFASYHIGGERFSMAVRGIHYINPTRCINSLKA